jgi:hypothetical protein
VGDLEVSGGSFAEYVNVPATIGEAISGNFGLLADLNSTLGLEDLHDIIEVKRIDAHNARVMAKIAASNLGS